MSYYSDVTIRCGEQAFSRLKESWTDTHLKPTSIRRFDDEYYIQWNDVKWYDYLDDVAKVISVLNQLSEEYTDDKPELGYCMCRIGEDLNDIEYTYNTLDLWVDISCKADVPLNGEDILP